MLKQGVSPDSILLDPLVSVFGVEDAPCKNVSSLGCSLFTKPGQGFALRPPFDSCFPASYSWPSQ